MSAVHLTLLGAIQWAFNFVASAAFLTFLSMLIRTRSDAKLKIKELEQLQQATEKGGVREDNKLTLETEKLALEQQRLTNDRAEKQYQQVCGERDYWRTEALAARDITAERDRLLGEIKTTFSDAYAREKAAFINNFTTEKEIPL